MNDYPWSFAAPEAVYYRGVCGYKTTHEAGPLKKAYERIAKEYPNNEWVKRALPYRRRSTDCRYRVVNVEG